MIRSSRSITLKLLFEGDSISVIVFFMGRRSILIGSITGVALILFWFWGRPLLAPSYTNFPPRAGSTWVAFGDSLTAGYGAEEGEDYPAVLSHQLGVTIENRGTAGMTTQEGLDHVEEIIQLKPRVVLLCLGGNDGLHQLASGQMFANLAAIIDRLHETGAFVILIGVRSATLLDRNEKPFRKLARDKNVLYVPNILEGIVANPDLKSDAIHPNAQGYRLIAQRLEKVLRPLMTALLPRASRRSSAGDGSSISEVNRSLIHSFSNRALRNSSGSSGHFPSECSRDETELPKWGTLCAARP